MLATLLLSFVCVAAVFVSAENPVPLLNVSYPYAIPLTVSASNGGQGFAVGLTLNEPRSAQFYSASSGKLVWENDNVGDVYVSASSTHPLIASYDVSFDGTGITLKMLNAVDGKVQWTYNGISKLEVPLYENGLQFARKGNAIGVLTTVLDYGQGAYGRLRVFSLDGKIVCDVSLAHMEGAVGLHLSDSGEKAFVLSATAKSVFVTVIDVASQKVVSHVETPASPGGAFCASPDGSAYAVGFDLFMLYSLSSTTQQYVNTWNKTEPQFFVTACTFSPDSQLLGLGLTNTAVSANTVELWAHQQGKLYGTYTYPNDVGSYEDMPTQLAFTTDGTHVAVSSWGHTSAQVPTVNVFAVSKGSLQNIFSAVTVGSMFAVDILARADGKVAVAAAGKAEHANVMGYGGSAFMWVL